MVLRLNPDLVEEVLAEAERHSPGWQRQQIKSALERHKVVFLYLRARHRSGVDAWEELRQFIEADGNPDRALSGPRGKIAFALSDLHGYISPWESPFTQATARNGWFHLPARPLPAWFKRELRAYLQDQVHRHESKDFAFWLTAKVLSNGITSRALSLVRQRWRIDTAGQDPIAWFRRMNAAQEKALSFARSMHVSDKDPLRGASEMAELRTYLPGITYGGGSGARLSFRVPVDERRLSTYADFRQDDNWFRFGLPIHDYERDLSVLVWLSGGLPSHITWRHWVETVLWDFRDLPMIDEFGKDSGAEHWAPTNRSVMLPQVGLSRLDTGFHQSGKVRSVPPPFTTFASVPVGDRAELPGITFVSRWIDIGELGKYARGIQADLVYSLVEYWGDYEPLPGHGSLVRNLESLLRTTSRAQARASIEVNVEGDPNDWSDVVEAEEAQRRAANAASKRRSRLG